MKVVISEWIDAHALSHLRNVAEVTYQPDLANNRHQLVQLLRQADALIVRNQTVVDRYVLEQAQALKVIGRLGAGLDNLDLSAIREKKLPIVYAPSAATRSVAEYCLGLFFALARKFPEAFAMGRTDTWQRSSLLGMELHGQQLGLLGFGRIARQVAVLAQAIGMRVAAWSPGLLTGRRAPLPGVSVVDWTAIFRESTFVSVHLPLTKETRHFVDGRKLALMQRHAFLVNTSRGGIVDEIALYHALSTGRLRGAALDVREQEPPRLHSALHTCSNCILSPHVAAMTEVAQRRGNEQVVHDVIRVLLGQKPEQMVPVDD